MSTQKTDSPQSAAQTICPKGVVNCPVAAEVLSLRMQVTEMADLIRTDPLTGLSNYRYFAQALAKELERTRRTWQPTSLIMLDIDHFKKVNDNWGHETGNLALQHIAGLLRQSVRKLDIPCRYGGEEFAVILPDTSLPAAIQVAERIRAAIEETILDVEGRPLPLTASQGLACYHVNEDISPEKLVELADHYLYQAKQAGRNRVCHAQPEPVSLVSAEERQVLSSLFADPGTAKD